MLRISHGNNYKSHFFVRNALSAGFNPVGTDFFPFVRNGGKGVATAAGGIAMISPGAVSAAIVMLFAYFLSEGLGPAP